MQATITLPEKRLETSSGNTKKPSINITTSQGYKVEVSQGDPITINKTIDGKYLDKLFPSDTTNNVEKTPTENLSAQSASKKDFEEKRSAIFDIQELFLYHTAQVVNTLKESCKETLTSTDPHLADEKNNLDTEFDNFLKQYIEKTINPEAEKVFKEALKEALDTKTNTIDVPQLNKKLNEQTLVINKKLSTEIMGEMFTSTNGKGGPPLMPTFIKLATPTADTRSTQEEYAKLLNESGDLDFSFIKNMLKKSKDLGELIPSFGQKGVHVHVEFPNNATDTKVTLDMISTEFTSHNKEAGPSITSCTYSIQNITEKVTYHRTSHLVSDPKNQKAADIKEVIKQYKNALGEEGKPMIYNLLTSNHELQLMPPGLFIAITDFFTNRQTARLKILMQAQAEYNIEHPNDMFFTLNTPANTYGNVISLRSFSSLSQSVAQSNLIALGITLLGINNANVQDMIKAHQKIEASKRTGLFRFFSYPLNIFLRLTGTGAYREFKNAYKKATDEAEKDQTVPSSLVECFANDTATTNANAKNVASWTTVLASVLGNANIIMGCKSGVDRAGVINARIESIISKARLAIGKIVLPKVDLNAEFNNNCFSNASSTIAFLDVGSYFKALRKTGSLWEYFVPNTNKIEEADKTHLNTKDAGKLQSHKSPDFYDMVMASVKKYFSTSSPKKEDVRFIEDAKERVSANTLNNFKEFNPPTPPKTGGQKSASLKDLCK